LIEVRREGITAWDFEDLPESLTIERGDITVRAFPAIEDRGDSVALTLKASRDEASFVMRAGLRRLFMLTARDEMKFRARQLHHFDRMSVNASTVMTRLALSDQLLSLVADRAFIGDRPEIRTSVDFGARLDEGWNNLSAACAQVCDLADSIFARAISATGTIDSLVSYGAQPGADDLRAQMSELITGDFLVRTPVQWLFQFPRYLAGVQHRAEKLASGAHAKDDRAMALVKPWSDLIVGQLSKHRDANDHNAQLEHIRWLLEEYRVVTFAQHLGSAVPVSDKRLRELWAQYAASLGS